MMHMVQDLSPVHDASKVVPSFRNSRLNAYVNNNVEPVMHMVQN